MTTMFYTRNLTAMENLWPEWIGSTRPLLALRRMLFVSRKSGLHRGCLPHLLCSLRRIT